MNQAQAIFYVVSPLVTLLAVLVAYIALVKQSRPHILIHYRPNPHIPSMIDLVVVNLGGGLARDLKFSKPLPSQCWGIEKPNGDGGEVLGEELLALASAQQMIFDAGQYGGLEGRLGYAFEVNVSYCYMNPIRLNRKRTEPYVLSVSHLRSMPTRISEEQAIVEAIKGPNKAKVQEVITELRGARVALEKLQALNESNDGGADG